MHVLVLTAEGIRRIVHSIGLDQLMDRMITGLHDALTSFDATQYTIPPRDGICHKTPEVGLLEWMPTVEAGAQATIKIVSYHPTNPRTEFLPTILSSVTVFDTTCGSLSAVLDGTFLTALRTGAASAVASRVLAREDSSTLGLIGCGAQAITQFHALSRVFELRNVLLFDTDSAAVQSFEKRVAHLSQGNMRFAAASPVEILAMSDILSTATSVEVGKGPVFEDSPTKPWLHVNAVGSDLPGKVELPRSFLSRSLVSPDFVAQAKHEGECQQLEENQVGPELASLVKHTDRYHHERERSTVFDSTGWALEDHVASQILLELAKELGVGQHMDITCVGRDPKDPYGFIDAPMTHEPAVPTEPSPSGKSAE